MTTPNGNPPPKIDINDTLRMEGPDAVTARHDKARPFTFINGGDDDAGPIEALRYTDIARDPIPPREWSVLNRVPAQNVALFSGEGAIGKSLLLTQLSVAHVLARDWIGTLPTQGPAMYLNCEEDDDEICRRLEDIARLYRVTRADIAAHGLHMLSYAGRDAVLGYPDRTDHIRPTALFEAVKRDALTIRPKLIVLDTAADVFAGKENDRAQTRQFITLLRGMAIESGAAVILASHPSLTGIATNTGLSGTTAWHNSVRARMYFKAAPDIDDPGLRVLECKKNNYGPISESIVLRWRNGVYVPEPRAGSLEQLAADSKVDYLFLDLLRRYTAQCRNVSDKHCATYAPTIFAREPEAKRDKITRDALADAMTRLFAADKIKIATDGPPSRPRTKIVEATRDGDLFNP